MSQPQDPIHAHRLHPGQGTRLAELTTRGKDLHPDRDKAEIEFRQYREQLIELQNRFYADGRFKLLVIFQAMDAGGKDGTIRSVFRGVNPQGVHVTSFRAPSVRELDHDFLWRIHQQVPAAGMIGVFNRSHYEDVLVVRVDELVPHSVWQRRYEQINQFEKLLAETGTAIVKFYLHISHKEQAKRFQERMHDPQKQWKFSPQDLEKSKKWDAYMEAYQDALARCTTEHAPWFVIPADQNWYRDWAIARILVETIEGLGPRYPEPIKDLEKYR